MTFDYSIITEHAVFLLSGFQSTLLLWGIAVPISIVGSVVLVGMRLSTSHTIRALTYGMVETIRNVPMLIQAFLLFFGLPFWGIALSAMTVGITCLSLYGAVYLSECLRGGMAALPKGQFSAGMALGLTRTQTLRWVIAPQLPAYVLPSAANTFISLGKQTALLSVITVPELTYTASSVVGETYAPLEVYSAIAVMYWLMSECIACGMRWLEARLTVRT